jgi:thiol-disulfide isomerase/thioredoxin
MVLSLTAPMMARAGDKPDPAANAARGDESYAALKAEFDAAMEQRDEEITAAYEAAKKKGDAAVKAFRIDSPSPAPAFSPRFLAVAEKDPQGPDALDALKMALQTNNYGTDGKPQETRVKALKILHDYYVTSPKLDKRLLRMLASCPEKEARAFIDDVTARNPDRKVQALAYQALANHFHFRARVEKAQGKDAVAQRIAEGEAARSEAEKYTGILRERYGDLAADLSIGQPAPPLVGEALDGKAASLADLKGKVVVLDVWATWCGPCKAMIPHERAMVERLKGKPFALVSISADEKKETLKDFLAKESMPWTHWWSGPEGKIIETLNIQHYPTIFVLDAKGVIRYTEIRGEELEKAVNALLKETDVETAG